MGAGTKRPSAGAKRLGEHNEQSVANRPKGTEANEAIFWVNAFPPVNASE